MNQSNQKPAPFVIMPKMPAQNIQRNARKKPLEKEEAAPETEKNKPEQPIEPSKNVKPKKAKKESTDIDLSPENVRLGFKMSVILGEPLSRKQIRRR